MFAFTFPCKTFKLSKVHLPSALKLHSAPESVAGCVSGKNIVVIASIFTRHGSIGFFIGASILISSPLYAKTSIGGVTVFPSSQM